MNYLMKCGHTANAIYGTNSKPCCAICNETEIEKEVFGTEGIEERFAKCRFCGKKKPSSWNLPLFSYNPDSSEDSFYDGCMGWD